MLTDVRSLREADVMSVDVRIVGAGPTGLTLTPELHPDGRVAPKVVHAVLRWGPYGAKCISANGISPPALG